jgi:hypothetical protein
MSTSVSCSKPGAAQIHRTQPLQLASAIKARRIHLLKLTIDQAAEFAGLKPALWADIEEGFLPPLDSALWLWWTLAGTLSVPIFSVLIPRFITSGLPSGFLVVKNGSNRWRRNLGRHSWTVIGLS